MLGWISVLNLFVNFLITKMSGDESQPIEFDGFSGDNSMEAEASADATTHPSFNTHEISIGRVLALIDLRLCRICSLKPLLML